jgi:hypothetical protein
MNGQQPEAATERDTAVAATIVAFLRDIGLEIQSGVIDGATVLPGIKVERSILIFDPAKLKFPGDLLHEAGHLAVKTPAERRQVSSDMSADPAEEMMAIAWSYAAAVHLQLCPDLVFHPAGYGGGSESLIENFAAGHYLAVPMLQWLGLACDEKRAKETGVAPYPKMISWLRTS